MIDLVERKTRFSIHCPMRLLDADFRASQVTLTDIHLNGIGFQGPTPYPVGSSMGIEVYLRPTVSLRAAIRIVWQSSVTEDTFAHGAEFLGLTDEDRVLLNSTFMAYIPERAPAR